MSDIRPPPDPPERKGRGRRTTPDGLPSRSAFTPKAVSTSEPPSRSALSDSAESKFRALFPEIVVFLFCEAIAIPFCHAGAEAFVNQHYDRSAVGFGIGLPLALVGLTFHWWKEKIASRHWIERQASRWWPIALVSAFIYVAGPSIYRRAIVPSVAPSAPSISDVLNSTDQELKNIRSQLQAVTQERDGLRRELDSVKGQLSAARSAPTTGLVLTPELIPAKQGPITWNLDSQFLIITGGGSDAMINSVLIQGTSTTSIAIRDAYAISGLTGRRQELMANVQDRGYYPVDKVDIPPQAPVWLELILKPHLSIRDFLDRWGKFRVTIVYSDATIFEHEFDENYTRRKLQQQIPSAFGPRVTPRDDK